MISETVARLKVRRERVGLPMEKLAEMLEVSRVTLWRWETGRGSRKIRKSTIKAWTDIIQKAEKEAKR